MVLRVADYLDRVADEAGTNPVQLFSVAIILIGGWLVGAFTALQWSYGVLRGLFL